MTFLSYFSRTFRQYPEILPLVGAVTIVTSFGIYSSTHKILQDQDLRIRQNQGHITWDERLRRWEDAKKH
ncbi:hypothetical protein BCR44DRAFT_125825 [Catenaria anguillulae PL171]|uniref:Uncharacterized protein n=1 Tax=Catenaria anguillulae PL171 TaxID=765915 RepID=A0A1Y2HEQ1_9FUNG|nr:hypothetical protein BCR44DRAFT_125825 [Catenaria anguillulae PL171]